MFLNERKKYLTSDKSFSIFSLFYEFILVGL